MIPPVPAQSPFLFGRAAAIWLVVAAMWIPAALLWDYSWECTEGIDLFWSTPHLAIYAGIALAAAGGFFALRLNEGIVIGKFRAPLGTWITLWGTLAFLTATLFDRWWQMSYGLGAGIWHPPQILKAIAFVAIGIGALLCSARRRILFSFAGGTMLALAGVMTVTICYANRQHGSTFYQLACAVYPLMLVTLAAAGPHKFSAAFSAVAALGLGLLAVWLLPLIPGSPQVAPIYHPRDHLMPPPFPLLLVVPAFAMDLLLRVFPGREQRFQNERRAMECGLAFFVLFIAIQWNFSRFLLSPGADNWFFAGGGQHWPFFLKLDATARISFWKLRGDEINFATGLWCALLAVLGARAGLAIGTWMKGVKR